MIDIAGLTLEELGHLRTTIDDLLRIKRAERVANARREILVIINEVGVSLEELMETRDAPEKPLRMPVRIPHPNMPGVAWTGRGRYPNWMKALLAEGKSIDELKAI